jgi:hypothetical protein
VGLTMCHAIMKLTRHAASAIRTDWARRVRYAPSERQGRLLPRWRVFLAIAGVVVSSFRLPGADFALVAALLALVVGAGRILALTSRPALVELSIVDLSWVRGPTGGSDPGSLVGGIAFPPRARAPAPATDHGGEMNRLIAELNRRHE